jgi:hypothetical protein
MHSIPLSGAADILFARSCCPAFYVYWIYCIRVRTLIKLVLSDLSVTSASFSFMSLVSKDRKFKIIITRNFRTFYLPQNNFVDYSVASFTFYLHLLGLQARTSRVRFPVVSLEYFIDIILLAALL